jgi:hypothetical protein
LDLRDLYPKYLIWRRMRSCGLFEASEPQFISSCSWLRKSDRRRSSISKPRNTSHWQHSFGKTSGGRHPRKHTKLIQLSTGKSNRSQEQNHRRRHRHVISNLKPKPNKSQNSTAKLRKETETQEKPAQICTDL